MRYVYYNPETMQVEAHFDTPNLSVQANWYDKGLFRATIPGGLEVTRDCVITEVTVKGEIVSYKDSLNPIQPLPDSSDARLGELTARLAEDSITDAEVREMLRLERGIV